MQITSNFWFRSSLFLLLVVVVVGIFTVGDYGMSWDEPSRFRGGDDKLQYYDDLFAGRTPKAHASSYPGLFDMPVAWAHSVFPDTGTRSQKGHFLGFCFGLLGLVSIWRIVARIGGERAGFWALLFLAALPRYYGHMFMNPKDIPLAATYIFGCWALVELFAKLPKCSWKHVVWIGVASGLAMSCRIAGFLVLVYFGLFVGLYLISEYLRKRDSIGNLPRELVSWAIRGAAAGLIGFVILFAFWPTIHVNPFGSVGASVESAQSFQWSGMVLMDGHFWEAQDLPVYYLPYWLMRTTPEHVIVLFSLGLLLGLNQIVQFVRGRTLPSASILFPRVVLLFAGVFPVIYIIWKDPVLYDGLRHILFALPALVGVSALAFEWLLRWSEKSGVRYRKPALQGIVAVLVGLVLLSMSQLHPYQYVYFNQVSGGLEGANNRDETDYWGLSHKEAGEWLNRYIESIDPQGDRVYRVHQRYSRWMLQEALDPDRFELWQPREGADFFVSVTRFNVHTSYPNARLIHVVERRGVPLCFIFDFNQEPSSDL